MLLSLNIIIKRSDKTLFANIFKHTSCTVFLEINIISVITLQVIFDNTLVLNYFQMILFGPIMLRDLKNHKLQ